jgi:(1->4)-alpha-D-glucan 1-alpha-D-glucosylmutase
VDRLQQYMLKSVKEAKVHTSWLTPNELYEAALRTFIERVLTGTAASRFLPAFVAFQQRIARLGVVNSLAQTALKIGSPGVPDFYQGCEMWEFSLVDPDNRRPVDFDLRRRALEEVESVLGADLQSRAGRARSYLEAWQDGRIKLLVAATGLRLRKELPELFLAGEYVPLDTEVTVRAGAIAFARVHGNDAVVFAAPRLCASLVDSDHAMPLGGDCWKTSRVMLPATLAGRVFRHEITGAELRPVVAGQQAWMFLGQIWETVPVGMLRTT